MALQKGDADCTAGLAKRIYDARLAALAFPADYPADLIASTQAGLKADSYAIAAAIVDEIQANAEATVTVRGGETAGLQRYHNAATGLDENTLAPAANVALAGTVL